MTSFWTFTVGDAISGIALAFAIYKIISNHLWHLKQDLHQAIEKVEKKVDAHVSWHLGQKIITKED